MTRRLRALLGLAIGLLTTLALPAQRKQIVRPQYPRLSQRVNTLIGTDWVGNVYPGASAPFGMVQLSPDNGRAGWDYIAGYFYPDSTIAGFSHTHLSGTGAGDLYDISFLPVTLPALDDRLTRKPQAGKTGEEQAPIGIHARFSHATEVAKAGYYAVTLEPYKIRVELTATDHVGVQRYTFQKDADSVCIILNLDKAMNWDRIVNSDARAISPTQITGFRYSDGWARHQKVYFTTKLSRPAARIERTATPYILSKGQVGKSVGHGVILRLYYNKVRAGESITLCTALSGVSEAGALKNLQAEAPHTDFNRYRQAATQRWTSILHRSVSQRILPIACRRPSTRHSTVRRSAPRSIATSTAATSALTVRSISVQVVPTAPSHCGIPTVQPTHSTPSFSPTSSVTSCSHSSTSVSRTTATSPCGICSPPRPT